MSELVEAMEASAAGAGCWVSTVGCDEDKEGLSSVAGPGSILASWASTQSERRE